MRSVLIKSRGRILGCKWDKSRKSFPHCYSQSPLLTGTPSPSPPPLSKSGLKLACNVNIVYGNLKSENSKEYTQKPQRNVHEFDFRTVAEINLTARRTDLRGHVAWRRSFFGDDGIFSPACRGWRCTSTPFYSM